MTDSDLNPVRKIEYVLDLTKEYNNMLIKTDNNESESFVFDSGLLFGNDDLYLTDELGSQIDRFSFNGNLLYSTIYDEFGVSSNNIDTFTFTGYQYDDVADTYFAQAREYMPNISRFAGADINAGYAEAPYSLNRYSYCFNSPLILIDFTGEWPKWIETTMKVVTITAAVVAVGAVVVGTGGTALTIVAGAAVGGVVNGFLNEEQGGSYTNGWIGGAISGAIQTATSEVKPFKNWFPKSGTAIGGLANGIGSYITDKLDNIDPTVEKKKTEAEIRKDALENAGKGFICSLPGQYMKIATDNASVAKELMSWSDGMSRELNQLYGILDNLLLADWNIRQSEVSPCAE